MNGVGRYLKSMYEEGKATIEMIENAVTKGWITEEDKNIIINNK